MWKKVLMCFSVMFASLGVVSSVWACSNHYTQAGEVFARPIVSEQDTLPSNFMFFDAHQIDQNDTPPTGWILQREQEEITLTFALEEEFVYSRDRYQTTAYWWVPEQTPLPGDILTRSNCGTCFPYTLTASDFEPPRAPELLLRDLYQRDGSGSVCEPLDLGNASFYLRFDDEQQAREDVLAKVYIGATAEEVLQAPTPLNIQHVRASTEHVLSLTMAEETSDMFSLDKPFCISVVVVDAAGQESPASSPLCIDPQAELDPTPTHEDGLEDPSCTTASKRRSSPINVLSLFIFALFSRWRSIHPRRKTTR